MIKFRNVARKAFAAFNAGQESQPSRQEQEQLSLLSGNSQFVIKGNGTETSPSDSTDSNEVITPRDIQSTLQEHFRNMEWEHQKYDISSKGSAPTLPLTATYDLPPAPFGVQPFDTRGGINDIGGIVNANNNIAGGIGTNNAGVDVLSSLYLQSTGTEGNAANFDLAGFDMSIFDTIPALAPGQLPMPLDGVNYNFNLPQGQNAEDPLDFLSGVQTQGMTPEASWDYVA